MNSKENVLESQGQSSPIVQSKQGFWPKAQMAGKSFPVKLGQMLPAAVLASPPSEPASRLGVDGSPTVNWRLV